MRILFVCTENANRSQMAEAFARMYGKGSVEAASAGSRPGAGVNPKAVAAMAELGYDLSAHRPKGLEEIGSEPWDCVVTMGCGDACPGVPAKRRIEWELPDPKALPPEEYRKVRDEIGRRVRQLLANLQRLP